MLAMALIEIRDTEKIRESELHAIAELKEFMNRACSSLAASEKAVRKERERMTLWPLEQTLLSPADGWTVRYYGSLATIHAGCLHKASSFLSYFVPDHKAALVRREFERIRES